MALSDEEIKKFKEVWEKDYGQDITNEQAYEYSNNLLHYVVLLLELAFKEQEKKRKFKKFPKGFHIEGIGYTCCICYGTISNDETWYDACGIKCLKCQAALNKKIIPKSVCKDKNSWVSMSDLQYKYKIYPSTVRKMVRNGELKARIIKNGSSTSDFYVFLKKENKML